jgi:hypothetical protein
MADLAAAVGLGGDCLADIAVLREQPWRLTIRDFLAHWGRPGGPERSMRSSGVIWPTRALRRARRSRKDASKTRSRSFRSIRHPETLRPSREGESQDTEDAAEQVSAAMS